MEAMIGGSEKVEIVQLLVENSAEVHLMNNNGKSSLMMAEENLRTGRNESAKKALLDIVEILKKADPK